MSQPWVAGSDSKYSMKNENSHRLDAGASQDFLHEQDVENDISGDFTREIEHENTTVGVIIDDVNKSGYVT